MILFLASRSIQVESINSTWDRKGLGLGLMPSSSVLASVQGNASEAACNTSLVVDNNYGMQYQTK